MGIEVTGTYLFNIVDHGVGLTNKSELPQWVANLKAAGYYDEESETWVEISSEDDVDITNYAVLMGKEGKPLLSAKQLMKAVGWDGLSFESLHSMDLSAVQIQGRVVANDPAFADKNPFQIEWIDSADAIPGRRLQKLNISEVKPLSAKFANGLRALAGAPKPKSVPAKPKIPDKPMVPPKPVVPPKPANAKDVKAAMKAQAENKKERGKQAEAAAPKSVKVPVPKKPAAVTMEAAWEACCNARSEGLSDVVLGNNWNDVIEAAGGEDEIEKKGLWGEVRDAVIVKCNAVIE